MKIYNPVGIFASPPNTQGEPSKAAKAHTTKATAKGPQNAPKSQDMPTVASKPKEEVTKLNAHDKYTALKATNPRAAGIYYDQNKQAIWNCIKRD